MSKESHLSAAVDGASKALSVLKEATDAIKPDAFLAALNGLEEAVSGSSKAKIAEELKDKLIKEEMYNSDVHEAVQKAAKDAADASQSELNAKDGVDNACAELSKLNDARVRASEEFNAAFKKLGAVYGKLQLLKSEAQFLQDTIEVPDGGQIDLSDWFIEILNHLYEGRSGSTWKKAFITKLNAWVNSDEQAAIKVKITELRKKNGGPPSDGTESLASTATSAGSDTGSVGNKFINTKDLSIVVAMYGINSIFADAFSDRVDKDKYPVFSKHEMAGVAGVKATRSKNFFKKSPSKAAAAAAADETKSLKDMLEELKGAEKELARGAKADPTYDEAIDYLKDTILSMEEWGKLDDAPEWLVVLIGKIKGGVYKTSSNVSKAVKALDEDWLDAKLTEASAAGKLKPLKRGSKADAASAIADDSDHSDAESVRSLFVGRENNTVSTKDVLISAAAHYVNTLHNKLYAGKNKALQNPLGENTPKKFVHKQKYGADKAVLKGVEVFADATAAPAPREPSDEAAPAPAAAAAAPVDASKGKYAAAKGKSDALIDKMEQTEEIYEALNRMCDKETGDVKPVDGAFPFDAVSERIDAFVKLGGDVFEFEAASS